MIEIRVFDRHIFVFFLLNIKLLPSTLVFWWNIFHIRIMAIRNSFEWALNEWNTF